MDYIFNTTNVTIIGFQIKPIEPYMGGAEVTSYEGMELDMKDCTPNRRCRILSYVRVRSAKLQSQPNTDKPNCTHQKTEADFHTDLSDRVS